MEKDKIEASREILDIIPDVILVYATFFTVRADEFDSDLVTQGLEACRQKIEEIENKGNEATAKEKNLVTILELAIEMFCRGIKLRKVDLWESVVLDVKDSRSVAYLHLRWTWNTRGGGLDSEKILFPTGYYCHCILFNGMRQ